MHIRSLSKATELKGRLERAQQTVMALDTPGTSLQLHVVDGNGKTVSIITSTSALLGMVRGDVLNTIEETKAELRSLGLDFD